MQITRIVTVVYEGGGWLNGTRRPVVDSDQLGAADVRADGGYTLTHKRRIGVDLELVYTWF